MHFWDTSGLICSSDEGRRRNDYYMVCWLLNLLTDDLTELMKYLTNLKYRYQAEGLPEFYLKRKFEI